MRKRGLPVRAVLVGCICALYWSASSGAESVIGVVKTVKGNVAVYRDGKALPVEPGTVLMSADRIVTSKDSALGIALKDDTIVSMGSGTTVTLDRFAFNSTSNAGDMALSILRGSMVFVTGLIGKFNPQAVAVKLPTATVGIRGTEFAVEVNPEHRK